MLDSCRPNVRGGKGINEFDQSGQLLINKPDNLSLNGSVSAKDL